MEEEFVIEGGKLKLIGENQKPPISERKLQANRQNALKSTGPKTERGRSYSRYNAAKHGILGSALLLQSGAGAAEFNRLVRELCEELQPVGRLQELLVEEMAICYLRKQRVLRYESGAILEYEKAAKSHDEQSESVAAARRQLVACLKRASREVRRSKCLTRQTADELESLMNESMDESALEEFHQKFDRAGLIDVPDANPAGNEPEQASGPPDPKTVKAMRDARLRVIAEYLEPLEEECAEEDQRLTLRDALASLPPVHVVERVLRYQCHIDRRLATLFLTLSSLQSQERAS